ncbi:zinc finger protein 37 [Lampris incognitus]|uniref:zinc finger protein 37 n=1 Tax=Lampris incognitus TaxID=2546036 RepID=UPI0024B5BE31|nr:zinc finger protein 37 [Lampris incognitus]
MDAFKEHYRDIDAVTLHIMEGEVSSSLYCGSVPDLDSCAAGLVEAFLVELYRCRLCQFTSSLKKTMNRHILDSHDDPSLEEVGGGGVRRRDHLSQSGSPYDLDQDLNTESKHSDEDPMDHMGLERMPFLLPMYGILPNISPRSCEMGLGSNVDGNLQVAQTCEVSTLFEEGVGDEEEEEESMFPLKGSSVALSCTIMHPKHQDEEMAQSAHLMTLGLCRISTNKPAAAVTSPLESRLCLSAGGQKDSDVFLSKKGKPASYQLNNVKECREAASQQGEAGRRQSLLCAADLPNKLQVHTLPHLQCSPRRDSWEATDKHCKRKRRLSRDADRQRCDYKGAPCDTRHKHTLSKHDCLTNSQTEPPSSRLDRCVPMKDSMEEPGDSQETRVVKTDTWCHVRNGGMKRKNGRKGKEEKRDVASCRRRAFCCSLCNRKFSTKLTLRRHIGIHQGEKPYECPHCDYRSRLKASLVQHIRTHTGEKPYRCPECPYASIDRSSLRRHSRTHTREKPYHCQYCSYSSIQKKSLDLHARRHHTGESFPCQLCQYSNPDRQLLLRHVRKYHSSSQHALGQQQASLQDPDIADKVTATQS